MWRSIPPRTLRRNVPGIPVTPASGRLSLFASFGSRPTEAANEETHHGPNRDGNGSEGNVSEQEAEEQAQRGPDPGPCPRPTQLLQRLHA
ncbi:MAG: hypothetical protein PVH07_07555 [Chloroflexota bacterium]